MAKKKIILTYKASLDELLEIQEQLENNEIGIEELTTKVGRAKELLNFCQEKLHKTASELEEIIAESEQ